MAQQLKVGQNTQHMWLWSIIRSSSNWRSKPGACSFEQVPGGDACKFCICCQNYAPHISCSPNFSTISHLKKYSYLRDLNKIHTYIANCHLGSIIMPYLDIYIRDFCHKIFAFPFFKCMLMSIKFCRWHLSTTI